MTNTVGKSIAIVLAVAALTLLGWWFLADPVRGIALSLPGQDNRGVGYEAPAENITIGEYFEAFGGRSAELNGTWPRFRGGDYDNIYKGTERLINSFDKSASPVLWSAALGEGHAGPAIYRGRVYVMDYDEESGSDMLRCFSLTDGSEIWRRGYRVHIKRNHGMSRTIPAVTEDYILTIGPRCHVMCVDRETGDFLWGIDIEKEYASEVPLWYTGQCPLIDNNMAILATGGSALMVAVDCATGEAVWQTPNPRNWKMSHSSVMPWVLNGRKMYVYSAIGGICGIAADGPDAGAVLWETTAWNHDVVAPSPVCMPDGRIFMTAGYGTGSMVLQVTESDGRYSVTVLQEYKPSEGLACEQQTPVYSGGLLYGIMPKDGGTLRNQLVCVSPDDPRKVIWSSGAETRFGMGPYILADGKLYLLHEDGTLYIIRMSDREYRQLDSMKIFDGVDAWAPMAIADGYLVMRDSKTLYCIKIAV